VFEALERGDGRGKEGADLRLRGAVALAHVRVVGGEAAEHGLVVAVEGRVLPLVPDEGDHASRTQDAHELGASLLCVEPVKGLRGRHERDGPVIELRRLRGSGARRIARLAGERALGGCAHRCVRLHADDARAGPEQEAREDPGARADVRDDALGPELRGSAEQIDRLARVARPPPDVVVDAAREALLGILAGHVVDCGACAALRPGTLAPCPLSPRSADS
jgi:hypothetical protein